MTTRAEWLAAAEAAMDTLSATTAGMQEAIVELEILLHAIPDVEPLPPPVPEPVPVPVPEVTTTVLDAILTTAPAPIPVPPPGAVKPIYYYHPMASTFGPTLTIYGAVKAYIVYQDVIDAAKDGKFDGVTSSFKARVEKAPADYTGVIAFDWEHAFGSSGGFVKALGGRDGAARQTAAIAEAVKVLKAAKAIRPKAKVGFYAVPFNGWSATLLSAPPDWWWTQVTALQPLLAVTDVLLPDIYQYFTIGSQVSAAEDAKRMHNFATLCLRAANGKPIYPFVWEIYHSAGPNTGVIPPDQIKLHVGEFCKTILNDRRAADGLYWWGKGDGPVGTEPSLKALRQALDG